MSYSLKTVFAYADGKTRTYTQPLNESTTPEEAETTIKNMNAVLTGGTQQGSSRYTEDQVTSIGYMKEVFISTGGAAFVSIASAQIISEEEVELL